MDYCLTTNNLKKSYGNFKALNGLTMKVPKGSIYGFVGRNGAGKTTLIRLICGLQQPTAGDYTLYGKKHTAKDIVKSRRRMGAVVETPSIYLDLTAEDNLRDQYRVLGLPSFHNIPELLQFVGLGDTGKRKQKISHSVCASVWALPSLLRGIPIFLFWMNPSTDSIHRVSLKCVSYF